MNPISDALDAVVEALAGLGVPVHRTPPAAMSGPCVVLLPEQLSARGHVTLRVLAVVPVTDNATAAGTLHQLIYDTQQAAAAANIGWADADLTPGVDRDTNTATAALTLTLRPC